MKSSELRSRFLEFFETKGHKRVKSDSLIPRNDPTLLFTGAGMNQFKDYFLGARTDLKRAASSQKCLRTGDLDQVGRTPYHHSFFEMLGNFSFGDYFKKEAIAWAWEFLTGLLKLPPDRLYVSVHQDDSEAFDLWSRNIGIPDRLIARLGDHDNFWPADAPKLGPNGPCGPCSEIFFDQNPGGRAPADASWSEDETGRFAEIWNLVFTQFERVESGKLLPLKSQNIDTGMGLERLACVIQKKKCNFETDLFAPLVSYLKGRRPAAAESDDSALYAIADHARAAAMAISDGAHPANEGRGYVIRKLIRRAVWHGRTLELDLPLLVPMVPLIIEPLEDAYPELRQNEKSIRQVVASEESRFQETLGAGLNILTKLLGQASKRKEKRLSGEDVFLLYDTYGFPDELTRLIAQKEQIDLDESGFQTLLEEQRKRAKSSSKLVPSIFTAPEMNQELVRLPATQFIGHSTLEGTAKVLWRSVSGKDGVVVLDETPFYPEGGGQAGDSGILSGEKFEFQVSDTQKRERVIVHYGTLLKGRVEPGDECRAQVNADLRHATKRNHTATHLLQAALRSVLGTHVRQVGSLVNPEKLRFDFTHGQALTADEIKNVERWVNQTVLENREVQPKFKRYEEAVREGVLAFFGDKYEDEVRVIEVSDRSKELCGGTHCSRTGDIGAFVITSETSVGSGVRRIEALTGLNAVERLRELKESLNRISEILKVPPGRVVERIEKWDAKLRELEKSGAKPHGSGSKPVDLDAWIRSAERFGQIQFISRTLSEERVEEIRQTADRIRKSAPNTVLALFSISNSKVTMIIALSEDLASSKLDAKQMAQAASVYLKGSAGGRKDLAQGGGQEERGIDQALNSIREHIKNAAGIACK